MKGTKRRRRGASRHGRLQVMSRAALFLVPLLVALPLSAGMITCDDQVNEARAWLAQRLDRASKEKLDEASRLCSANETAEALAIVQQVRDAFKATTSPADSDH
jgi:hypothetical protein